MLGPAFTTAATWHSMRESALTRSRSRWSMIAMSPGLSRLVRFLVRRSRRAGPITPGKSSDLPRRDQGRRRDGDFIALPSCQTGRVREATPAITACYHPLSSATRRRTWGRRARARPTRFVRGPGYCRVQRPGDPAWMSFDPCGRVETATRTRPSERSIRALINDRNHHSPAVIPAVGAMDPCVQDRGSALRRAPGNGQPRGAAHPHLPSGPDALSEEDAEAHVHGICFKTGPPGQVGVELEWLVSDQRDPALRVDADRVMQVVAGLTTGNPQTALRGGGTLSTEPGGQLELSSAPATSLGGCIAAAGADLATLRDATHAAGLRLSGHGLDPLRPPQRVLDLPRYAAMEEFFDRRGPWGRVMMCNTASVQVCVDAGQEGPGGDGYRSRWRLVHAIGPVLVAAFANSPVQAGQASGWRCTRQVVWSRLD